MMQATKHQDYTELKTLLNSWNLRELFDYFKDEGINIEELFLMKFHHIDKVLKHFKYGIRIRFEHCLEQWRSAQNKPLALPFASSSPSYVTDNHHSYYDGMMDPMRNTRGDNASNYGSKEPLIENLLSQNFLPSEPFVSLTELEPDMKISLNDTSPEQDILLPTCSQCSSDNGETTTAAAAAATMINSNILNSDVTVMHILLNSGPKGSALYEYRLENQPLSQAQRTLLIQLIVNYFELHDLHLSLTLSHLLETQILNIFPKEQLSFYRTEKRGKIYVKFTNMKRYRRERPMTRIRRIDNNTDFPNLPKLNGANPSNACNTDKVDDAMLERKRQKIG